MKCEHGTFALGSLEVQVLADQSGRAPGSKSLRAMRFSMEQLRETMASRAIPKTSSGGW